MELGAGEIIVILVIVLLLFGPTKLPQLGESLGRGIRSFKKALGNEEPTRPADPARDRPDALPEASPTPGTQADEPKDRVGVPDRR